MALALTLPSPRALAPAHALALAIARGHSQGQYKTKLGFGLHFGWSVEGPVGSPTKIDCSYLSPEVRAWPADTNHHQ